MPKGKKTKEKSKEKSKRKSKEKSRIVGEVSVSLPILPESIIGNVYKDYLGITIPPVDRRLAREDIIQKLSREYIVLTNVIDRYIRMSELVPYLNSLTLEELLSLLRNVKNHYIDKILSDYHGVVYTLFNENLEYIGIPNPRILTRLSQEQIETFHQQIKEYLQHLPYKELKKIDRIVERESNILDEIQEDIDYTAFP